MRNMEFLIKEGERKHIAKVEMLEFIDEGKYVGEVISIVFTGDSWILFYEEMK